MLRSTCAWRKSACRLLAVGTLWAWFFTDPGVLRGWSESEAPLPPGVKVVWDVDRAWRESTPTRERVCLNGLWRWQPAEVFADELPRENWGFFKVPGPWPGITDYMQKDFQRVIAHPAWGKISLRGVTAAWYERQFTVPEGWSGRRIFLRMSYVNSRAIIFVDGKRVGQIRFPAGEVELTQLCQPGRTYRLTIFVEALPLKEVMTSYADTAAPREVRGRVARRGLCGDVFLEGRPAGPTLGHLRVETSVRQGEVTFHQLVENLPASGRLRLEVTVAAQGREIARFGSPYFAAGDLEEGTYRWRVSWRPDKLWDIHTPGHQLEAQMKLVDEKGQVVDVGYPVRFGFREFWIEGRDFYLNGTRIFLCVLPLDNAQIGVWPASYEAACETLRRLKRIGINFVYTHHYDCLPGSHLALEEILRAADDVGMLVALTQPHFSHYDWRDAEAEKTNGYAEHARFYVEVAGSHPSVVAYATSHNATGYAEDMNPFLMDGRSDPRETWGRNNAARALRAEAIIRKLDPSRVVYHHASGNLSALHASNFYPNWVPIQEMDDWFGFWASQSIKPMMLCEYGAPFAWDWTMYRGWYQGARSFGSAVVPWDYSMAEWNAQFLGVEAYQLSERQLANIRWEAEQFRRGNLWYRWDYPTPVGDRRLEDMDTVQGMYMKSNWRAFRTWGVSAISPWELYRFWRPAPSVDSSPQELPTDWDNLQRPGYSPDFIREQFESIEHAFRWEDWAPTPAAEVLLRDNQPLLAYLAGEPGAFTSKAHNYYPGEVVRKQIVFVNNSRETVSVRYRWGVTLPGNPSGEGTLTIPTGEVIFVPIEAKIPEDLEPGRRLFRLEGRWSTGEVLTDELAFDVLARPPAVTFSRRLAVYDPVGETAAMLRTLGLSFTLVPADATEWPEADVLVIGKKALSLENRLPSLERVRQGLDVVVFEQTTAVLERRLGFRVAEYGLRQVFALATDHPVLAGLQAEHLADWRGEATLLPPRLEYRLSPRYAGSPVVDWCGLEVPRLWRCGCRGNVASVSPEKPARGDFLPIVDGGFSLQYAPLLVYREGKGRVVFCQLDVTGRTESDPAAQYIVRGLFRWLGQPQGSFTSREVVYVGDPWGWRHLEHAGFACRQFTPEALTEQCLLVVGPGGEEVLAPYRSQVEEFIRRGGACATIGLRKGQLAKFLPLEVTTEDRQFITDVFTPPGEGSAFCGVSPADVHNRTASALPLVTAGAERLAGGVLAEATLGAGRVVFFQLVPWELTRAEGRLATFSVDAEDAFRGKQSALLSAGTTTQFGIQFGQAIKFSPEMGKKYTFSAWIKPVRDPVTVRLEVERAGSPWDRAVRTEPVTLPAGKWSEVHATFTCEKPYPEGWQAYVACSQDGALFRVDDMRLYSGEYVHEESTTREGDGPAGNLIKNGSFEDGPKGFFFQHRDQYNVRKTYRRVSYALSRMLANLGAQGQTPLLERLANPPQPEEKRYLTGLYVDQPEEWDDPYRFFRW
ncbi:MAG: carbohydrate binding domain-containing protein [Thermoguttaceae bacterium]|nr:carbohydrate binding domain-containing protein [Thermoguttaceae bacterium]